MYTQCPHCQTIFGVSDAHLSAAFGRVRCGHCHGQFNAKLHLLNEIPSPPADETPASSETDEAESLPDETLLELAPLDIDLAPTEAAADAVVDHIDLSEAIEEAQDETEHEIIIDLDLESRAEAPAGPEDIQILAEDMDSIELPDQPSHEEPDQDTMIDLDLDQSAERPLNPEASQDDSVEMDSTELHASEQEASRDELDAIFADLDDQLERLSDDSDESVIRPYEKFELGDADSKRFDVAFGDPNSQTEDDIRASIETIFAAAEAELIKTESDESREQDEFEQEVYLNEFLDEQADLSQFDLSAEANATDEQEAPLVTDNDAAESPTHETPVAAEEEAPDSLPNFTQEELPFVLHGVDEPILPARRSRIMTALYSSSIVLLVLAAVFQLALFRNVELATQLPALKPALVRFCQLMPCQYSGVRDTKQIVLTSRDVRSHPDGKNTILINAIFVNRAAFKQPYPDILITLSDLTTTVVSQRRFTPAEYLSQPQGVFQLMKPGKPVHISLEVLDPGNDAVNFQFEFL